MQKVYQQDILLSHIHTDRFGRLTPAALLYLAQEVSGDHCHLLGADGEALGQLFWAISRTKVEVAQLPKLGQTLTLETWPMPTTRVAYPRATEGFDDHGNSLFKIISLWVIMDMDTRAMVLPGKSGIDVPGTSFGTELKAPGGLPAFDGSEDMHRTVTFSDLDVNGHMNNTRYLDWICDLLPAAFHKDHPMKAVSICYMSEALEGQSLRLSHGEGDVFKVDGSLSQTDASAGHTRIFSAQVEF